jgi:formylglycine-generating enzyme required for sulfatase activity
MKQFLRPGLRVSLFAAVTLCGWALAGADEQALKPGQQFFKDCATDCPEMVVIPAGSFAMGSPDAEPSRKPTEAPRHNVTLAKPFAVSKFEVTFAEWDTCAARGDCTTNVSDHGWGRDRQPVINVSWGDAQRYVAWLSKITGKPYRLLTEAEYEYATRARTQTAYSWGDDIGSNNANCTAAAARGTATKPLLSAPSRRTSSVSMIWSATSGSGCAP